MVGARYRVSDGNTNLGVFMNLKTALIFIKGYHDEYYNEHICLMIEALDETEDMNQII